MKELNEMTLVEIKALEEAIKTRKAELKVTAKADKASATETKVAEVNELIANGTIKSGMKIVVLYGSKNIELTGTVVGVLDTKRDSITVESNDFDGKANEKGEKRRYIKKERFVKVAE